MIPKLHLIIRSGRQRKHEIIFTLTPNNQIVYGHITPLTIVSCPVFHTNLKMFRGHFLQHDGARVPETKRQRKENSKKNATKREESTQKEKEIKKRFGKKENEQGKNGKKRNSHKIERRKLP